MVFFKQTSIYINTFHTDVKWIKLKLYEENDEYPFKIIAEFIFSILSLPQSNVSCKQMFSKVNLIKTKQRNWLQTPALNGILNANQRIKETSCHKFEPATNMFNLMTTGKLYNNANHNEIDDDDND